MTKKPHPLGLREKNSTQRRIDAEKHLLDLNKLHSAAKELCDTFEMVKYDHWESLFSKIAEEESEDRQDLWLMLFAEIYQLRKCVNASRRSKNTQEEKMVYRHYKKTINGKVFSLTTKEHWQATYIGCYRED